MKSRILTAFVLAFAAVSLRAGVWINCDFSTALEISVKGKFPICGSLRSALPPDAVIQEEEGNRFLRYTRVKNSTSVTLSRGFNLPELRDFAFSARFRMLPKPGGFFWFSDFSNKPRIGFAFNENNGLCAYDVKMAWQKTGIVMPPAGEWFTLRINGSESERAYTLTVVRADGSEQTSTPFPYLHTRGIRNLYFGNVPGAGKGCDMDDIVVEYSDDINVKNRVDVTAGAIAHYQGTVVEAYKDGIFNPPLKCQGNSELGLSFTQHLQSCAIIVRGKSLISKPVRIEVWGEDAAGSGLTKYTEGYLQPGEGKSFQELFVLTDLKNATLKFPHMTPFELTEVRFVGMATSSMGEKEQAFLDTIYGEFRCAVWQDQLEAKLHLINAGETARTVKISGTPRHDDGKIVFPERTVELASGENIVTFPLAGLANSDYAITIADASGETSAKFRRLLRYYPLPEREKPAGTIGDMTSKKLLFPDAYYLEDDTNLDFRGTQAKHIQVIPETTNDEDFCRYGVEFGLNSQNQMQIDYYTLNRNWDADSKKYMRTTCVDEAAGKWNVTELPGPPPKDSRGYRPGEGFPPPMHEDWDAKGKDTFFMYDATRDGKPVLNQVKFRYTGAVANATDMWKESSQNWGCIQVPPRTTFLIWRKEPGRTLVLNDKPFLSDHESFGEFEDEDATHDNFVGQWMSAGGKKLCFSHGRWMKTYPPFESPAYDNMRGLRILGLWSTDDTVNFEQTGLIPPDESDPPVCQQYGGHVIRLRQSNGLMLGFILRYKSIEQQMDTVLAYSWDGIVWRRVKGPVFLPNGKPGSWNAGAIIVNGGSGHRNLSAVIRGDLTRLLIGSVDGYYHFQAAETTAFMPNTDKVTMDYIKRKLGANGLEKWPYFEEIGGYEGFLKHCHTAGKSISYAEYRNDGYFYMTSVAGVAECTTRTLRASKALHANIAVGKSGFVEIALLDAAGKELAGYAKRFDDGADGTHLPVFDKLPDGEFKVRLRFQNTQIYALEF